LDNKVFDPALQVPASLSVQSFPTTIPVRILMATMQSRFKFMWLLPLGLS